MYGFIALLPILATLPEAVWGQDLTSGSIAKMGNNSLFDRWRPSSRFIAPAGWMNDPCGLMYDETRDVYHSFYQWHPNHVNWGNISWGHAVSKDLVTWTDVGGWRDADAKAIGTGPRNSYNFLGIFSGTAQPVNLQGKKNGDLTGFYTSVAHLPTSWTLPYIPHTESQSIVTSKDGGMTWEQYAGNPVIYDHPPGWNITGWRDPFVLAWPEMDKVLKQKEPHYYAVFGSGIKGVGPRIPLYSAKASDLTKWKFLGALWEPKANSTLGNPIETGVNGFNFEVSGAYSLIDSAKRPHFFVNMGSEGGNVSFHQNNHWALWQGGMMTRRANGSAEFHPTYGGAADFGNLYAVTSFWDSKNNRRVQWGWSEEDMNGFGILQQGFQGSFGLPREVFVHEKNGVVPTKKELATKGASRFEKQKGGTYKAYTLGVTPLPDVVKGLRDGCESKTHRGGRMTQGRMLSGQTGASNLEMSATFDNVHGRVGMVVAKDPSNRESTTIFYDSNSHTITVDRSRSTRISEFNVVNYSGYFKPYTLKKTGRPEPVNMRVFQDGSLLEVYVNRRWAMTLRIYPSLEASKGYGLYIGHGSSAEVSNVQTYINHKVTFPERPNNSSSKLVFDTPQETNNYVWWPGY